MVMCNLVNKSDLDTDTIFRRKRDDFLAEIWWIGGKWIEPIGLNGIHVWNVGIGYCSCFRRCVCVHVCPYLILIGTFFRTGVRFRFHDTTSENQFKSTSNGYGLSIQHNHPIIGSYADHCNTDIQCVNGMWGKNEIVCSEIKNRHYVLATDWHEMTSERIKNMARFCCVLVFTPVNILYK